MAKEKLTQERLKEVLHYNPDTGVFTWKKQLSNRIRIGAVAGSISVHGYRIIGIAGHTYRVQRLACLYIEGYFPEHQMDHKYGVRSDNRWGNLRQVTARCNAQNLCLNPRNKSGFPGVSWCRHAKKWVAQIEIGDKSIYLGRSSDLLEAALTRLTLEVWCSEWNCNYRSELVKAIKKAWPEFNGKCLS